MKKPALLALASLLLAAARASAAPAEPELHPFTPAERTAPPPRRAPPRAAAPAPEAPPPRRDEVRETISKGPPRRAYVTIRTRAWIAQGSVDTRYSVQIPRDQIDPPADVFYGETDEREASGTLLIHGVEVAPLTWLSAELEYGEDKSAHGTYTDRLWLHSPESDQLTNLSNGAVWHNPDHEDDRVYKADNTSRRDWLAVNVFFRVHEGRLTGSDETEIRHTLDVSIGAHRFRQDSRFTNLARTQSTGKLYALAPVGPIPGFNGTYSAAWRGPHVGFREEIFVPMGFSFDALLLWSPVMEFHGDGYDNLDGSLRSSTPNYTDRAHGSALHFRLGAAWNWSIVRLEAGFMRLSFTAKQGARRYYNSDGTTFDRGLEYNRTEVSGLYAGGAVRF